jgi:catechol 2,3-dioxygenase-like lactoylglutathione lyase family enzyme
VLNHVGLCVHDLDRSRRFYEGALGFTFERDLEPPDQFTAPLLRLDAPVGLRAVYLRLGGFVLELLAYAHEGHRLPARERSMAEPGLTHLSIGVDDLAAALARVEEHGGTVLPDTNLGMAVFVRDPDGQLIELLATT